MAAEGPIFPKLVRRVFFPQNCCPPHSSRHLLKYIIHIFYVLYITYIFYTLLYTIFSTSTSTSTSICHMFCCAFLFVSRNRAKPPQARPSKTKRRHDRAFHPCSYMGSIYFARLTASSVSFYSGACAASVENIAAFHGAAPEEALV